MPRVQDGAREAPIWRLLTEMGASGDWDTVIKPRGRGFPLDFAELWGYRDLVWMLFRRDFITMYKQTILGPAWYLIQPSTTAFTYLIVFGKIAKISTEGLPPFVFYMSGIVLWTYFASCLSNNSEVFSRNAGLFGKVYFPRLIVPLSVLLSGLIALSIQFTLLIVVSIGFVISRSSLSFYPAGLLLMPFVILYVGILGMTTGLIVSACTIKYRDLAYASSFATQLWMYATPVVYPYSQVPSHLQWLFNLNPMTTPVESIRSLLFGTPAVSSTLLVSNLVVFAVIAVIGVTAFSRAEATAMDTV